MTDWALMNQLLFEGKHEPVKKMTEEALAAGHPAAEAFDGLVQERRDGSGAGLQVAPIEG